MSLSSEGLTEAEQREAALHVLLNSTGVCLYARHTGRGTGGVFVCVVYRILPRAPEHANRPEHKYAGHTQTAVHSYIYEDTDGRNAFCKFLKRRATEAARPVQICSDADLDVTDVREGNKMFSCC